MATQVAIPSLGDSVSEAVLTKWLKADGDYVKDAEAIAELETDKANVDLPSPTAGVFKRSVDAGGTVKVGQVVASIDEKASAPAASAAVAAPAASAAPAKAPASSGNDLSPAPRRIAAEAGLDAAAIAGTGPNGRVTKEDAAKAAAAATAKPVRTPPVTTPAPVAKVEIPSAPSVNGTRREPMSKIRKKIGERLLSAQQNAAILTTFNEVDLTEVIALRAKHKETFEKQYGVGLGFMSFFVKASCNALKAFPKVNAQIDGDDVVYNDGVHMGIAVSTERGLVVPVLKNAERLSFAQVESEIKRLAIAARDGKLGLSELSGGTFTITNGGVFGSLLSTPIINPPQSGILGMHTIQKRAMVISGAGGDEIKVRSMMYIALSYDHRLVDGKDSVSFLVKIKQLLEDPSRLLLEV